MTTGVEPITITGIQTTDDEKTYSYGSEGYILSIENSLIEDKSLLVNTVGAKLTGVSFMNFSGEHLSYPLADFMDLAYVIDRNGKVNKTILTDITFNFLGFTSLKCSAENAIRNSSKYVTSETKAIQKTSAMADKKISEDNTISSDKKRYYAQNSIEIMDNTSDRQARAKSLGSYNDESFNNGVRQGYENIVKGTVSGSKNNANWTNNSTNPIHNQNVQNLSANTQQTYNDFVIMARNGESISRSDAIKMFHRLDLSEQKDFLRSLSPEQVSQIPISVCNMFPDLIATFVDLGKGIDIIQQCSVGTGNKTIQLMAKSKGATKKQFDNWAANHTDRLAKCTYDDLVESGAIKVNKNKSFFLKA